jgi:hypothetical protein
MGSSFSEAQKFALLLQRLALDINTMTYTITETSVEEKVRAQVANHMRSCVAIGEGIKSLHGIAASEPILSEVASQIMRSRNFSLPHALTKVLSRFCINPGGCTELLVFAFFTWARDKTVLQKPLSRRQLCRFFSVMKPFSSLFSVPIFMSMLHNLPSLCPPGTTQQTFGEVFDKALMHFNHFIKPQEQSILARCYFPAFIAHGMAALGANCQPGIDTVYLYLYDSNVLAIKNIGFIIVQVEKNDVSKKSQAGIFQKMDPFGCSLLLKSDNVDGKFPPHSYHLHHLCTL